MCFYPHISLNLPLWIFCVRNVRKHAWNIGVKSDLLVALKAEFDAIWPLVSLKKHRFQGLATGPHLWGLQCPPRAPSWEGPPHDANASWRLLDSRPNHFLDFWKINSIILDFGFVFLLNKNFCNYMELLNNKSW